MKEKPELVPNVRVMIKRTLCTHSKENYTNITIQSQRNGSKPCPGFASININHKGPGKIPLEKKSHCHMPNPAFIELVVAVDEVVKTATLKHDPYQRIFGNTITNLCGGTLSAKIHCKKRKLKANYELKP